MRKECLAFGLLFSSAWAQVPVGSTVSLAASVTVPIDFSSGRPAVLARIGGKAEVPVVFDTGSQGAVIPKSLADAMGLEVVGEALIGSPYGQAPPIKAFIVSLGGLSIGGIEASDATAVVMDDGSLPPNDRRLLIGPSQFAKHVIALDFETNRFTLSAQAPPDTMGWQPLSERNFPVATLKLGPEEIGVVVDSGNPHLLNLPKAVLERIAPGVALVKVGEIRTVDARIPRFAGTLNLEAQLAGLPVSLGRVEFAEIPQANLGVKALRGLKVTIDMPGKRWRLDKLAPGPIRIGLDG